MSDFKKIIAFFMLLNVGCPTQVFAQADHQGNGGGEDVEFNSFAVSIRNWVNMNYFDGTLNEKLKLNFTEVKLMEFVKKLNAAMDLIKPDFVMKQVLVKNHPRVCKNLSVPRKSITCDIARWLTTPMDIRYTIVLHEYLGLIGLENNVEEFSQYTYSANLLHFVYLQNKFELGNDYMDRKRPFIYARNSTAATPQACVSRLITGAVIDLGFTGTTELTSYLDRIQSSWEHYGTPGSPHIADFSFNGYLTNVRGNQFSFAGSTRIVFDQPQYNSTGQELNKSICRFAIDQGNAVLLIDPVIPLNTNYGTASDVPHHIADYPYLNSKTSIKQPKKGEIK